MRKVAVILLILTMLVIPVAQAVTIDGPINFVASHGGSVRLNTAVISSNINIINGLHRFGAFTIGGTNRGALAFDCSTGTVMNILSVTQHEIRYQVTAVGASTQYVYYGDNLNTPEGTNTDNIAYNAATGISTITTTGNVIVTLNYATLSGLGIDGLQYFMSLFPIIAFIMAIEARKRDMLSNGIVVMIMVFAVAAFIIVAMNLAGV